MDEKRMGEIALALIRLRIREEPTSFNNLRRELGSIASRLGHLGQQAVLPMQNPPSSDELYKFFGILLREVIDERFPEKFLK